MRRRYRINTDSWQVLFDILSGTPDDFTAGCMRGVSGHYLHSAHWLSEDWAARYKADDVQYTIYSFDTPIAWLSDGVWTVPDVKYSVRTSKHQGKVRMAVGELERLVNGLVVVTRL